MADDDLVPDLFAAAETTAVDDSTAASAGQDQQLALEELAGLADMLRDVDYKLGRAKAGIEYVRKSLRSLLLEAVS